MKHIITAFVLQEFWFCNSSDKTKTATGILCNGIWNKSTSNNINKQLKNIDTDEALIAIH
jgi:hypothetical protein